MPEDVLKSARCIAVALLVAFATGCSLFGKGGESTPSPLDVAITAAPRLNPDERGG